MRGLEATEEVDCHSSECVVAHEVARVTFTKSGKGRQHADGLLEGFCISKHDHTKHDSAVHSDSVSRAAFP